MRFRISDVRQLPNRTISKIIMDRKIWIICCKIFVLSWIISVTDAEERMARELLQGAAGNLLKTQNFSQRTNGLGNSTDKVGSAINYTVPRQPEIGLKNIIRYNKVKKHFYRHSPSDVHLLAAPITTRGAPWPMPKNYKILNNTKFFIIEPERLYVYVNGYYNDILEFNLKRLWKNLFAMEYSGKKHKITYPKDTRLKTLAKERFIKLINITIQKEATLFPNSQMNESYSLSINTQKHVELISSEVWGAIRGLETLSQLIIKDRSKFYLRNFTIQDSPRFSHRGLMIDTARHFISKEVIIKNLEAMAQNKLNVFHWHMTDDHSFPFDSHKFPNITKYGAYNPETHVYRHSDVSKVINEARFRGIRVIPEFDTPGHSFSWGFGQPDLLTPCFDKDDTPNRYFGPINPIREKTYKILQTLYEEILEIFPDNTVHIGGDEVNTDCWNSNPEITDYLNHTGLSMENVLSTYTARLQLAINNIFKRRSKTRKPKMFSTADPEMIVWQEAFDDGRKLNRETIIQLWKNAEDYIQRVTDDGFKVIYSACWYLDVTTHGIDWDLFYDCLTTAKSHPTDYDGLLIGGEICLWTEYIDDQTIMAKLWPRASAAAERLWSRANQSNFQEAAGRLEEHNCRMKRSGIPSGVLNGPGFCGDNLFADATVNVTWSEEPPPTFQIGRKNKYRKTVAFRLQRKNKYREKDLHYQRLSKMVPESTKQRVYVLITVMLVIFAVIFMFLFGLFCAFVWLRHPCPLKYISICKNPLLRRKVMLFLLAIGIISFTSNGLFWIID